MLPSCLCRCKRSLRSYLAAVPDPHEPSSAYAEPPSVPLPDFFVLGAMKAGTTSLYHDLRRHPAIILPDKESNALLCERPAEALATLFPAFPPEKLCGEVCPDYTKLDCGSRAAKRARDLYCGNTTPKLIYLIREPITRLRSHHYFISSQFGDANPGGMTADIEHSLRDFPELIETSCYASRIRPWIEAFGNDEVHMVRFEDYIANRSATLADIASFLGLEKFPPPLVDDARIHNPSASRPVATLGWRQIMEHPFYRRCLRPLLPLEVRDRLRRIFFPKPPPPPSPPRQETLDHLIERLRPEVDAISALAGRRADRPLWDLDEVRSEILSEGQQTC